MDGGFWSQVAKWLTGGHGVQTLMSLTGRLELLLGSIALALIAYPGFDQSSVRPTALIAIGVAALGLYLLALVCGLCWPTRFHYGAHELMRQQEMDRQSVSPASNAPDGDTPGPTGPR